MANLVFAISGASGMPLARHCLDIIARLPGLEAHIIISEAAKQVMKSEASPEFSRFTHIYANNDLAAPPASGSWQSEGMIVCPCSANTLAAVAVSLAENLIQRAALVTLKERRPLILCLRETPFSLPLLRAMQSLTEAGGIIMPFIPAFYGAETMEEAMSQFCGHILDLLKIPNEIRKRWPECAARKVNLA